MSELFEYIIGTISLIVLLLALAVLFYFVNSLRKKKSQGTKDDTDNT